jgi:hypothetical protein
MVGREVHVYVRHGVGLLVQEALEKEVMGDGVHPGDAQHVGHQRVGGRTPALRGDAPFVGVAADVPHDEEVSGQPGALYHLQLVA